MNKFFGSTLMLTILLIVGSIAVMAKESDQNTAKLIDNLILSDVPEAKVEGISRFENQQLNKLLNTAEEISTNNLVPIKEEKKPVLKKGAVVGCVINYHDRKLKNIKLSVFNDDFYREMKSTYRGNFGFSVPVSNTYTLTAQMANQYYYTNMVIEPNKSYYLPIKFTTPINIKGRLMIDSKPAQQGILLRLIGKNKSQAGGVVFTNGYFKIRNLTPGKYTVVLERRKRFIDKRINENRFYYFNAPFTNNNIKISVTRDSRKLTGVIKLDGLPQSSLDALVTLKDARSKGLLIHREAFTYPKGGFFSFNNILPGYYQLQVTQTAREWKSKSYLIQVKKFDKIKKIELDIVTDPTIKMREIENLKRQFRK